MEVQTFHQLNEEGEDHLLPFENAKL